MNKTSDQANVNIRKFRAEMETKFPFSKGMIKLDKNHFLTHIDRAGSGTYTILRNFMDMPVKDTMSHFGATAVMESPGPDEIVCITEPGKYAGHVFWSDHVELYTLEYLEDPKEFKHILGLMNIDDKKYRAMSKDQRIESMPFFKNRMATSLKAFFKHISIITKEEYHKFQEKS